jgi:hypothetical protein
LTDKKVHLENFLRYGKALTKDEAENIEEGTLKLKEVKLELETFKKVIDFYLTLRRNLQERYDSCLRLVAEAECERIEV